MGASTSRAPASKPLGEVSTLPQEKKYTNASASIVPAPAASTPAAKVPMIPLSSINKYDIPFLGQLLGASMNKSQPAVIPEPPKSKPPSLPVSVEKVLPLLTISQVSGHSQNNSSTNKNPDAVLVPADNMSSKCEHLGEKVCLSVEYERKSISEQHATSATVIVTQFNCKDESNKNNVVIKETLAQSTLECKTALQVVTPTATTSESITTATKQVNNTNSTVNKCGGEKEWYWDYDDNCWKECDPDEDYEWEYIESDDDNNDGNNNVNNKHAIASSTTTLATSLERTTEPKAATTSLSKRSSSLQSLKEEVVLNITKTNNKCVDATICSTEKGNVLPDWQNFTRKYNKIVKSSCII
jgi:hypothetical protein